MKLFQYHLHYKSLIGNHFYQIDNMNETSQPETNKYVIQTRSQT